MVSWLSEGLKWQCRGPASRDPAPLCALSLLWKHQVGSTGLSLQLGAFRTRKGSDTTKPGFWLAASYHPATHWATFNSEKLKDSNLNGYFGQRQAKYYPFNQRKGYHKNWSLKFADSTFWSSGLDICPSTNSIGSRVEKFWALHLPVFYVSDFWPGVWSASLVVLVETFWYRWLQFTCMLISFMDTRIDLEIDERPDIKIVDFSPLPVSRLGDKIFQKSCKFRKEACNGALVWNGGVYLRPWSQMDSFSSCRTETTISRMPLTRTSVWRVHFLVWRFCFPCIHNMKYPGHLIRLNRW